MKKLTFLSLVGIISMSLAHAGWAAPHGGGGGGFGGGGGGGVSGGGHSGSVQGGGVSSRGGGVGFGRPVSSGRPAYYYSRGMHYTNSRIGTFGGAWGANNPLPFKQAPALDSPGG